MNKRKEVITNVLEAFLGEDATQIGNILDADEIEILAKALDEALEK